MINSILKRFNMRISWINPTGFHKYALQGKGLVGAEVGVYQGDNAKNLFKTGKVAKLYLIDNYNFNNDYEVYGKEKLKMAKTKAGRVLNIYNVKFIYTDSIEAIKHIPEKLDFVYIDANHRYEFVKKEIEAYWKIIKEGGILGGHDVTNVGLTESPNAIGKGANPCGVLKAFVEFANKHNLYINVHGNDWWVVK